MSVRVHPVQGHWTDVHDVYTWEVREGALVLHTLNHEPDFPLTGVELLAVFAAGQWTSVHCIETPEANAPEALQKKGTK